MQESMLDVKPVPVSRPPVIVFAPDVLFTNERLRKVDAMVMSNIACREIVWKDVGVGRVEKRWGFKEGYVFPWYFFILGKILNDF